MNAGLWELLSSEAIRGTDLHTGLGTRPLIRTARIFLENARSPNESRIVRAAQQRNNPSGISSPCPRP